MQSVIATFPRKIYVVFGSSLRFKMSPDDTITAKLRIIMRLPSAGTKISYMISCAWAPLTPVRLRSVKFIVAEGDEEKSAAALVSFGTSTYTLCCDASGILSSLFGRIWDVIQFSSNWRNAASKSPCRKRKMLFHFCFCFISVTRTAVSSSRFFLILFITWNDWVLPKLNQLLFTSVEDTWEDTFSHVIMAGFLMDITTNPSCFAVSVLLM